MQRLTGPEEFPMTPRSSNAETELLIVGAGPVGLFLASECARRGMRYRLVEERATQSEHSKALAIFPRTLEIFDMAGIAAPFLEAANRVTSVAVQTRRPPGPRRQSPPLRRANERSPACTSRPNRLGTRSSRWFPRT